MALGTQNRVEILISARDEASKRMESVAKSVQDMGNKVRGLALQMTAMGTAIVGAIAGAAYKLGDMSGELQKMAKQTGTTTETFQRLKFAIEQNEGSTQNLVMGMTILRKSSVDAARGGEEAQAMFTRLGVSFKNTDGSVRNTKDILLDLADVMAAHKNDPEGMADALEALGMRGGKELVPLLQLGKQGILDYMASAKGIISEDTLNKLDNFQDKINAVKTQLIGALAEGIKPLVPYLTRMADFIANLAAKFDALNPKTKEWIGKIALLTGAVLLLTGGPLLMLAQLLSLVSTTILAMTVLKIPALAASLGPVGLAGSFRTLGTSILATIRPLVIAVGLLEGAFRIGGLIANQAGKVIQGIGGILGKKGVADFGGRMAAEGMKETKEGIIIPMIKDLGNLLTTTLEGAVKIPKIDLPELAGGKTPAPPGVQEAIDRISPEEYLSEKNKIYLETIRLTKGETFYELEKLRIERDAFRAHWAEKKDLIKDYEAYYLAAVANVTKPADIGLGKGSFGLESYIPAMMGVQGAFTGSFQRGPNVMHFTIYANDDKVGDAVQRELNKRI